MLRYLDEDIGSDGNPILCTTGLEQDAPSEVWYPADEMDTSYGPGLYDIFPISTTQPKFVGHAIESVPIEDNRSILDRVRDKLQSKHQDMAFKLSAILRCTHPVTSDVFYAVKLKNIFTKEFTTVLAYKNALSTLDPFRVHVELVDGELFGTIAGMIKEGCDIKRALDETYVLRWVAFSTTSTAEPTMLAGKLTGNPRIHQMFSGYLVMDADHPDNGGRIYMRHLRTRKSVMIRVGPDVVHDLVNIDRVPDVTDVVLSRLKEYYYNTLDTPNLDDMMMSAASRIAGLINMGSLSMVEIANTFRVYIINRKIIAVNFIDQRGNQKTFSFGMQDGLVKAVPRIYVVDSPRKDVTEQVLLWMRDNHMFVNNLMVGRYLYDDLVYEVRYPLINMDAMDLSYVKRNWSLKRCVVNKTLVIVPVRVYRGDTLLQRVCIPFWNMRFANQVWLVSDVTKADCDKVIQTYDNDPIITTMWSTIIKLATNDLKVRDPAEERALADLNKTNVE